MINIKKLRTTTIQLEELTTSDEIKRYFHETIEIGKIYYVYSEIEELMSRLEQLYRDRQIAKKSELVRCNKRVRTIEVEHEQIQITERYHRGLTNRKAIPETDFATPIRDKKMFKFTIVYKNCYQCYYIISNIELLIPLLVKQYN